MIDGFTKKYNLTKLIYFEVFDNPQDAIFREKQLKKWRREKKINLVRSKNPDFQEVVLD